MSRVFLLLYGIVASYMGTENDINKSTFSYVKKEDVAETFKALLDSNL